MNMLGERAALAIVAAMLGSAPTHAAVTISTAATRNMRCVSEACVPTATNAVLNVNDLENDLSQSGNFSVATTGNGVEANDIIVNAAFTSPDSTNLTFYAHKAITVNAAVSIGSGIAALVLQSDTLAFTDALTFGRKGHITFGSLSDPFAIDGVSFILVGSVQGLASAVAANPSGAYALAVSYNAKGDGTYKSSPVSKPFSGNFEGLGNQISSLRINDTASNHFVALFSELKSRASVRDLTLVKPRVTGGAATNQGEESIGALVGYSSRGIVEHSTVLGGKVSGGDDAIVGGLVGTNAGGSVQQSVANSPTSGATGSVVGGLLGQNQARNGKDGTVSFSHALGDVTVAGESAAGGLVGNNFGIINTCYAGGAITATGGYWIGGLAGESDNLITQSFATGAASGGLYVGGLAGFTDGQVEDSYATGAVASATYIGGLTGENDGITSATYSTGQVSEAGATDAGGLEGIDESEGTSNSYWDTDMSGITNLSQGAGSPANDPGITGLTTEQFQSGLPDGFDPKVWAENPNINNGLPYLIANPPPK